MRVLFIFLICLPFLSFAQSLPDTTQKIMPGRENSPEQRQRPYVIFISADGFRHDLADKYQATHLLSLRSGGVAASSMKPVYPSLTFPNHYSLATGLYPAHHGLVDNTFYDPQKKETYHIGSRFVTDGTWYGGTPIWVLAEQQHMLTASFYWVGSEAAIQDMRPTYYYAFNNKIGIDARIQAVKDWLTLPEEKRPHLITFYLPEVDHAEHLYGVDSKEAAAAVHLVDDCIGAMSRMVDSLRLPVSFIFVSDHGMANVDTTHRQRIILADLIDTSKFIITPGEEMMHLYAKDKKDILPAYEALKARDSGYSVYLTTRMPERWHYNAKEDRYGRIGDILLLAKFPGTLPFSARPSGNKGAHGYDNAEPDMQASFYAWGPAFRHSLKIGSFDNVDVYPLIAKILGLPVTGKIDGSLKPLQKILH